LLLKFVSKLDILHKASGRIRAVQKGELGAITPFRTIKKKKKLERKVRKSKREGKK